MDNNIGENIKKYRKIKGFTQAELSEKIDVVPQYFNKIENGKSLPSLDTLIKICNELDISADELIYGKQKIETALITNKWTENLMNLDIDKVNMINDIINYAIENIDLTKEAKDE